MTDEMFIDDGYGCEPLPRREFDYVATWTDDDGQTHSVSGTAVWPDVLTTQIISEQLDTALADVVSRYVAEIQDTDHATIYYLDTENGDDANDGLTYRTAKRTSDAVEQACHEGDTIVCVPPKGELIDLDTHQ